MHFCWAKKKKKASWNVHFCQRNYSWKPKL